MVTLDVKELCTVYSTSKGDVFAVDDVDSDAADDVAVVSAFSSAYSTSTVLTSGSWLFLQLVASIRKAAIARRFFTVLIGFKNRIMGKTNN